MAIWVTGKTVKMQMQEHVDRAIKKAWLEEVARDYNNHHLLREDSVKCSLYHHLRNRLGEGWFKRHRIRIYPEFILTKGRKADIAVVRMAYKSERAGKPLSECIETVLSIVEIKYKQGSVVDPFYRDRRKLRSYAHGYPDCQLYAAFIHEDYYVEGNSSWFDDRQTVNWAKGRVVELLGYWNEQNEAFVSGVRSYNGMNEDLCTKR